MISSTGRSRGKDYRYYTCLSVRQRGTSACSIRSVPADALESFVVARIRELARTPSLIAETVSAVAAERSARTPFLDVERRQLERERAEVKAEASALVSRLAAASEGAANAILERLAVLELRTRTLDARIGDVVASLATSQAPQIDSRQVAEALLAFDEVWNSLTINEQIRVVRLVVEGVEFDGVSGKVSVTYSPPGLALLREEAGPVAQQGGAS